MVTEAASPSRRTFGGRSCRSSIATVSMEKFGNPYSPNDRVFGNLISAEQGQHEGSQSCWILGTVISIDENHVLVGFSDNSTRRLPISDVVLARHFNIMQENADGPTFASPRWKYTLAMLWARSKALSLGQTLKPPSASTLHAWELGWDAHGQGDAH
ncbi:unnamed protein product [Rhizoctonia solani]|uniref:Uncharacterized protein n=1 Tax=Rhizoctonia solani TaxID=456999 RepID=A0A8H3BRX9_9AGAM|nr:unnamed protein product [Rhizoctonia solani]